MGVLRPDLIIKNVVPVIMAGIIGIYGLVVAVLVSVGRKPSSLAHSLLSFPFYVIHSTFHLIISHVHYPLSGLSIRMELNLRNTY